LLKLKTQPGRTHLFVSYSRSDRIAVDKLVADLRQRGYILWMDVDDRGIEPGEDWQRELVTQMSAAEGVLACLSPDFLASPYCKAEIEQALNESKPVYPTLVRRLDAAHTLAEFKLDRLQYSDLTADYSVGLRKLLVALPRPQQPFRRALRTGGWAAAALAALVIIFLGVMIAAQQGFLSIQPTLTAVPATATVDLRTYDIGVVMTYFTVDPSDAMSQSDADAAINRFARALDLELTDQLSKSGLTYKLDGPSNIPRLTSTDPQARQQEVAALLQARGAKVAIYGLIHFDATLRQAQLEPQFYVAADQYFNDAQDITGSYAFGKNIPADSLEDRSKLNARITALSYLMTGLFQHMTRHYDSALTAYQTALETPNWSEQDGKEILYTLIGNTQMKLAEQAARQCDRATVLAHADAAESAYKSSQEIADAVRPDFPRAYAGLANTYAVRALWLPEANDKCASRKINREALQQAAAYIDEYRAKLDPLSEDPGVQRKMLLTEVQVRFLLWAVQDRTARSDPNNALYQSFDKAVEQIIKGYTNRSDSTWAFPVMEAYIFRGQALYARQQYRDALASYDLALKVFEEGNPALLAPERVMTAHSLKGDAFVQLRDYTSAAQEYGEALTLAQALNLPTSIAAYQARQKQADEWSRATPTLPPLPTATPDATEAATQGAG